MHGGDPEKKPCCSLETEASLGFQLTEHNRLTPANARTKIYPCDYLQDFALVVRGNELCGVVKQQRAWGFLSSFHSSLIEHLIQTHDFGTFIKEQMVELLSFKRKMKERNDDAVKRRREQRRPRKHQAGGPRSRKSRTTRGVADSTSEDGDDGDDNEFDTLGEYEQEDYGHCSKKVKESNFSSSDYALQAYANHQSQIQSLSQMQQHNQQNDLQQHLEQELVALNNQNNFDHTSPAKKSPVAGDLEDGVSDQRREIIQNPNNSSGLYKEKIPTRNDSAVGLTFSHSPEKPRTMPSSSITSATQLSHQYSALVAEFSPRDSHSSDSTLETPTTARGRMLQAPVEPSTVNIAERSMIAHGNELIHEGRIIVAALTDFVEKNLPCFAESQIGQVFQARKELSESNAIIVQFESRLAQELHEKNRIRETLHETRSKLVALEKSMLLNRPDLNLRKDLEGEKNKNEDFHVELEKLRRDLEDEQRKSEFYKMELEAKLRMENMTLIEMKLEHSETRKALLESETRADHLSLKWKRAQDIITEKCPQIWADIA